jgi:hypothetical protein
MPIRVTCPNGHLLRVKDRHAGQMGLCPFCRARVEVPQPNGGVEDEVLAILGLISSDAFDRQSPADKADSDSQPSNPETSATPGHETQEPRPSGGLGGAPNEPLHELSNRAATTVSSDAVTLGHAAYWDGVVCTENPYDPEKQANEYKLWNQGWRTAQQQDFDEIARRA